MNSSPEEALFDLALEKAAEKHAAFLDVMCKGAAASRSSASNHHPTTRTAIR